MEADEPHPFLKSLQARRVETGKLLAGRSKKEQGFSSTLP